jgi:AAA15 family ATPase/GTPase
MIQEFSVKNFRSIKEKQTLSFVANKRYATGFEENLCVTVAPGVELLKLALLYGYNASGKSNIILALDFLRDLVLEIDESTEKAIEFTPFLFDEEYKKSPGEFSMTFFHEGIKYQYSISVDSKRIYDEELIFWPHGRPSLLFERHWDAEKGVSKLKVGTMSTLKVAEKRILEGNTLENRSVLTAYLKSNIDNNQLKKVVEFFGEVLIESINSKSDLSKLNLRSKDINIKTQFLERANFKSEDESAGSLRYSGLIGLIIKLLQSNHSVAIDELETSLHPDLVSYLLEAFLINSSNSQILATTHAQHLMESEYVRRDMVWFCEKGCDGVSEYYSAQDFGLHKNINLKNFYRAGKLGAVPTLGSPLVGEVD